MGKTRIIAETGAGQHGVATATACALLGLECIVYMGTEDMRRQQPNVAAHGAARRARRAGRGGRADAQGGGLGGDPRLGRQRRRHPLHHRLERRPGAVPGARARPPARDRRRGARPDPRAQAGRLPERVVACVGGGSNAIGTFVPFVDDAEVALIGVEAAGDGHRDRPPRRAADARRPRRRAARRLLGDHAGRGRPDPRGALDLGRARLPRHRARSTPTCATPAAPATRRSPTARRWPRSSRSRRLEGIIPALESSHAVAWVLAAAAVGARPDLPLRAAATRTSPRRSRRWKTA